MYLCEIDIEPKQSKDSRILINNNKKETISIFAFASRRVPQVLLDSQNVSSCFELKHLSLFIQHHFNHEPAINDLSSNKIKYNK